MTFGLHVIFRFSEPKYVTEINDSFKIVVQRNQQSLIMWQNVFID